jgi:hypothetical protein
MSRTTMPEERRQLNEWLGSLSAARLAGVIAAVVFVPLTVVFVLTGEGLGAAAEQAAFWAAFAVIAALVGRALGTHRRAQGPPPGE